MIVKKNSYWVVYNIIIMLSFVFLIQNSTHFAWDDSYLGRYINFSQPIEKIFLNIFIYLVQSTFATSRYRKKKEMFLSDILVVYWYRYLLLQGQRIKLDVNYLMNNIWLTNFWSSKWNDQWGHALDLQCVLRSFI